MKVLVVSTVHNPEDARIRYREIAALLDAGHQVVQAGPLSAFGLALDDPALPPGLRRVDVPRARGRQRVRALFAARDLLRDHGGGADIVVLHDPELLLAVPRRFATPVVWDVHEDTGAALTMKRWLPTALRPLVRRAVHAVEGAAIRRHHLVLAEYAYAERLGAQHPVVPNHTFVPPAVPPPGADRVVQVGALSLARGVESLIAVGRALAPHGITTELVGGADGASRPLLEAAVADGSVVWHGYLANDEAMRVLEGALAGLALLRDEPNYRHSLPSKVAEYMAHGVPVVTTPLPKAVELVEGAGSGVVVPFEDPDAVVRAVLALRDDEARRLAIGAAGHAAALADLDWSSGPAKTFVRALEDWCLEQESTEDADPDATPDA